MLLPISCKKHTDKATQNSSTISITDHLGYAIHINLNGKVLDSLMQPIQNVKVTVGNKTITTNVVGVFVVKNTLVYDQFISIEAKKENYKDRQLHLTSLDDTTSLIITLYKEGDLNLFRFDRNNHNLPYPRE